MHILKYKNFNQDNINKMKLDIYPILSEIINDDYEVIVYTAKFIKYFENVNDVINKFNFSNKNKSYECEFELDFNKNNIPLFNLNKISFLNYPEKKKITNQIKKNDYKLFVDLLDINYNFKVIVYPYQIVEIIKINNYITHECFYPKQQLYLKEVDFVESGFSNLLNDIIAGVFISSKINIHIDFDENIIYLEEETYPFTFNNGVMNINNNMNMLIKLGVYPNTINFGIDTYEIVHPTTIDVFEYFAPYEIINDLD